MGLFKHKSKETTSTVSDDPIVTYHITQSLNGKLKVTPTPSTFHAYSIILSRPKGFRDTIDVAVHRSVDSNVASSDVVGHCLIQVVMGKFLDCQLGNGTEVKLTRNGLGSSASYALETKDGQHKGLKWVHDSEALGGRTSPDRRLKLVDGDKNIIARFAGAATGVSEFGMLEVYSENATRDIDWCGLLVLTAVCVYAREERNREKSRKANNVAGFIGNWGGLLTMGIPVGGN